MFTYGSNLQHRKGYYKCRNQWYILDEFCSGKDKNILDLRGRESFKLNMNLKGRASSLTFWTTGKK